MQYQKCWNKSMKPTKNHAIIRREWKSRYIFLGCTLLSIFCQYEVISLILLRREINLKAIRLLKSINSGDIVVQHTLDSQEYQSIDLPEGTLNVDPTLSRQCVTIRFRGDHNNYTVDDAIEVLNKKTIASARTSKLRMGIMFLEDIKTFFPVRVRPTGNQYHMYHFVELLVIAYSELQRLANTYPRLSDNDNTDTHDDSHTFQTTLSKGSPSITVPWIFSPHMSPFETCGGASNINCVIADLVLQVSTNSIFTNHVGVIGLDGMEKYPFDYNNVKMKAVDHRIELAKHVYGESPSFANQADGVILVERFGCNPSGINKPWSQFIDNFPASAWHSDVLSGLGQTWEFHRTNPRKFVIAYIDRQNTDRRLPDEHHNWILKLGEVYNNIDFRQLHMEDYAPLEQIKIASECDMLIGVHGNGLTHSLWMQPRRYVIELFWKFRYQFDYATTAQLMDHSYLGIYNGKVVDPAGVVKRDPMVRKNLQKEYLVMNEKTSMDSFEYEGKIAIQNFIETAMIELTDNLSTI